MALTQKQRSSLCRKLAPAVGEDHAELLMSQFDEIVTKDFVHSEHTKIHAEFANVRGEMRAEFADVRMEMRTEFAAVRAEMRTGLADVRTEMHTEFANVYAEFGKVRVEMANGFGEMERRFSEMQRWMVGTVIAASGLVAAIVHTFG